MTLKCDVVFEGGGVKGIALVGAVTALEQAGYEFQNMVGASAGSIVAALLAVGYKGAEVSEIMQTLDYNNFRDEGFVDRFGPLGKGLSALAEYGIYEGTHFEYWFAKLLAAKGKTTFSEILTGETDEKYKYKFQAIASDVTKKRLLILPRDLNLFVDDPGTFPIAKAVRMSMSIPLFFEPVRLTDKNGEEHLIVDGGVLSNYPVWLLDDGTSDPPWPTFGLKLVESDPRNPAWEYDSLIHGLPSFLWGLISTMMDAHDNYHISNSQGDFQRTIPISTWINAGPSQKRINTTYFDITREESQSLYENGRAAAKKFLSAWNFTDWTAKYRQQPK